MKKLLTFLSSLAMIFVLFSCAKSEEPYLTVDKSNIIVSSDATTASINISSNASWNISGSYSWCSLSSTSGKGTSTVTLTIQPQMGHDERTATFTLSSKEVTTSTIYINLVQTGAPNVPPTAPVLTSPEDGAILPSLVATFSWQESTDANGDALTYTLKVSKDKNTWESYNTRELTYTINTKMDMDTEYFWKVEVTDGLGEAVSSETRSFSTPKIVYREEGEVRLFEENTKTHPINIIIMGDGFINEDLAIGGAYDKAMESAANAFFDIEPYRSYRNKFNVYFVYSESKDRGAMYGHGHDGSQKNNYQTFVPSTSFSAQFSSTSANSTSTTCNYEKCFEYARKVPGIKVGITIDDALSNKTDPINNCVIILVINDKRYAGTCSMWSFGACIGMCPMSHAYEATLRHEVGGHGFPKLGDEYVYGGVAPASEIESIKTWQGYGFYKNISTTNVTEQVPWKDFLGDSKFPEVGLYEGACTYTTGVWRSEQISCMVDNRSYFNGPSRYAIVERIMKISTGNVGNDYYVYPYEDFKAQDKKDPNVANGLSRSVDGSGEKLPPLAPPILHMVK